MDRYEKTRKIALLGMGANVLLLVLKLITGFLSRSQAMIADGFNSAGDVFASAMTYAGNKIASMPEDRNHPYGHGKAEYIFSMLISFSLVLVAYKIFRSSLASLLNRESFEFSLRLVGTAVLTILLKSALFLYTRSEGKKEDNLLILANAEDHRNDVFVTASTLLGILLGSFGIYTFDGIVGIGISLWIAFTGLRIFISAFQVLMDTNMDEQLKSELIRVIETIEGVDHVDDVSAKPIGVSYILIVKVSVQRDLTVEEGHGVAARIKEALKGRKRVGDVLVHVNPA